MITIDTVAKDLNIDKKELQNIDINQFLEEKLHYVESELQHLYSKHKITCLHEIGSKLKNGELNEENISNDSFLIDGLEIEKAKILELIEKHTK